jgi:hypothetical protein
VATDCILPFSSGLKAVNKISLASERKDSGEPVSFVTVFATYNSHPAGAAKVPSDAVTVGKHSYSKVERSMAILNTFVSFIQVLLPFLLVSAIH